MPDGFTGTHRDKSRAEFNVNRAEGRRSYKVSRTVRDSRAVVIFFCHFSGLAVSGYACQRR